MRRAGFTLIELLAVIVIIGILAGILVSQLTGAEEGARRSQAEVQLAQIGSALEAYANEKGDYPPSSFAESSGVGNGGTNVGIEALVVALWSDGYEAGGLLDPDELVNTDGDAAPRSLSDLGTRDLLEFVDPWGNAVAYVHRRDYETKGRVYLTFDPTTGEEVRSAPRARRNETTGRFYRNDSFQLFSAGGDGVFGTEDDVTNFREH